jgi:hypothetical protein
MSIAIKPFNDLHIFEDEQLSSGNTQCIIPDNKQSRNILFNISLLEGKELIHFTSKEGPPQGSGEIDCKVRLVSTLCHFGGRRWWFTCPMGCNRRVGVLYLLPTGNDLGCRHCHKLTYESSKKKYKSPLSWF